MTLHVMSAFANLDCLRPAIRTGAQIRPLSYASRLTCILSGCAKAIGKVTVCALDPWDKWHAATGPYLMQERLADHTKGLDHEQQQMDLLR